jgi:hypothetical protein
MPNPTHLRELASRMFALSMTTGDKDLGRRLALRASDYLDQAIELEGAKEPEALLIQRRHSTLFHLRKSGELCQPHRALRVSITSPNLHAITSSRSASW